MVEELRLNPLLPGGALVDECLGQPHQGAQSSRCSGGIQGLR